jgi:hypothetical protein
MSYSRRQLYAMGEPLGDGATRREVGGKIIYGTGGGGGGTPEKQTTVVDIPEWAKPYAKESLGKAAALTSTPYQAYGGERIAQFTPLQKQAFEQAGQQQVAGQVGLGSGLATLSGISSFQDPGTAQGFMSPYMDAVVQRQMESAQRQADIAATQRGAQAVRAGAFGGSRQAIENAEAARALASQKGQIQEQGLQSAFERAQSQFNAEQANRLASAQALGQLGQQQFGQQMDITGQQATFGGQQRQATQDILSQQYQDFLNQQRAPYDQLSFMSSLIRGTPMGQTTTMYAPPASQTSQLIGLATAGAGAYGAYQGAQKAAGGEVKGYAAGGIASLSDSQLTEMQRRQERGPLTLLSVAEELVDRDRVREAEEQRRAMMAQQPQRTVVEAALDQGIGGLDVPDDLAGSESMADGGIVAFSNGGAAFEPSLITGVGYEPPQESSALGRNIKRFFTRNDDVDALIASAKRKQAEGIPLTRAEQSVLAQVEPAASGIASVAKAPIPAGSAANRTALNAANRAADAKAAQLPPPVDKKQLTEGLGAAAPNLGGPGAAPSPSGYSGIAKILADREKQFRDEEAAATKTEVEGLAKEREALTKAEAEAKKYGAEQEEKYKKRGERLDKDEKNNIYMTMIDAGLAMAAGKSPDFVQNLAAGAQQGLKGYQGRLEKVNAGRDDLDEAMFKLYNIRNDKVTAAGDKLRELNRAETKVKADGQRALSKISEGMFGKQVDLKTKEIDQMFNTWKTKYEQGQANERAKIAAESRPDPILKDENYKLKARNLAQAEMLLNAQTDPEKRAKQQVIVNNMRAELAAMRGDSGSVGGGGSGTLNAADQALIDKYR